MKEDMGYGQEVTHLAFVGTDLPLLAHKNPGRTTRSVVIENVEWKQSTLFTCSEGGKIIGFINKQEGPV